MGSFPRGKGLPRFLFSNCNKVLKVLKDLKVLRDLRTLIKRDCPPLPFQQCGDTWAMLHSNLEKKTRDCPEGSYNIIEGK